MQVNMNYRKSSEDNQAKNLARLRDLMAAKDNRVCAECPEPNPDWAAINLGVFVCLRCSGLHRQLGVHVSKVKSCTMDLWNTEWVKGMLICIIFAPTIPYFTQIWIDQGMYDLMSAMAPQIKYG